MLEFKIKCMRFKNIYSYNADSNSSDWLNTIKKTRQGEIWSKFRFHQS